MGETVMAHYLGTRYDDNIMGVLSEPNIFDRFGIGHDKLVGGLKSDNFQLFADEMTDFVDGGYGIDTIDYSGADRALHIDLGAGVVTATFGYLFNAYDPLHTATVAHVQNIENATGSIFDDTIIGTDGDNTGAKGANTLDGGDGNDWLYGLGGNDVLLGGSDDYINGGEWDRYRVLRRCRSRRGYGHQSFRYLSARQQSCRQLSIIRGCAPGSRLVDHQLRHREGHTLRCRERHRYAVR
jgi:Ca2+-binding RTX toxin-like protein